MCAFSDSDINRFFKNSSGTATASLAGNLFFNSYWCSFALSSANTLQWLQVKIFRNIITTYILMFTFFNWTLVIISAGLVTRWPWSSSWFRPWGSFLRWHASKIAFKVFSYYIFDLITSIHICFFILLCTPVSICVLTWIFYTSSNTKFLPLCGLLPCQASMRARACSHADKQTLFEKAS